MIIHGKFSSDWDGMIVSTNAILDFETGEVSAETADIEGLDGSIVREWFEPNDSENFGLDDEIEVCQNCHQYILKEVLVDTDGTNLEPTMVCQNPDCE